MEERRISGEDYHRKTPFGMFNRVVYSERDIQWQWQCQVAMEKLVKNPRRDDRQVPLRVTRRQI